MTTGPHDVVIVTEQADGSDAVAVGMAAAAPSSTCTTKARGYSNGPVSADQILASVKRFCHKAQQTLCGEL
jgi:hypothetical protein